MMDRAAALASSYFPLVDEDAIRRHADSWTEIGGYLEILAQVHETLLKQHSKNSIRPDKSLTQLHLRVFENLHRQILYCYGMAEHFIKMADIIELGKLETTAIALAIISGLDSEIATLMGAHSPEATPDLTDADQAMRRIATSVQQQIAELPMPGWTSAKQ
ncbi:hypothetical protein DFR68_1205 [Nocardia mexicana]|uniref:Uncharacterized protein n=2 Tax=Nocardia mexicana TaxID=279262 RepID=A0A370GI93_9NOCA|nr:hypothetical protein DFR68_1205 [Nocardia mexicana]